MSSGLVATTMAIPAHAVTAGRAELSGPQTAGIPAAAPGSGSSAFFASPEGGLLTLPEGLALEDGVVSASAAATLDFDHTAFVAVPSAETTTKRHGDLTLTETGTEAPRTRREARAARAAAEAATVTTAKPTTTSTRSTSTRSTESTETKSATGGSSTTESTAAKAATDSSASTGTKATTSTKTATSTKAAASTKAATSTKAAASTKAASSGSSSSSTKSSTSSSSGVQAKAVTIASRYLGVKYRYGGSSPSGFDCSGLVQYVYAQLGVKLPRTAAAQAAAVKHIPRSQAKPGDLVLFPGGGHIAIYMGGNMMLDAPHTGTVVQIRKIYSASVQFGRVS